MNQPFSYDAIEAARKAIQDERTERDAVRILDLISGYDDDDNPHGTVFRFTKTYLSNPKTYVYAAVKVVDEGNVRKPQYWSIAGSSPISQQFTWDEFVMWLVTEGSPVAADDIEIMYPEGYEPPAKHVHGPECYGIPVDAFAQLFGNVPVPAPADADEDKDEELSDSDIVLTSAGEQAADDAEEAAEINGDRAEDVTRD